MLNQSSIVAVLVVLVVVLTILLVTRIRSEKQRTKALSRLKPADFSSLLSINSKKGTIADVAGKVSDLLRQSFGYETIIFLRKKRDQLICNFTHGLEKLDRRGFRIRYRKAIADHLTTDYLPRDIKNIQQLLPDEFYSRLSACGVDTYFPIFWRENLYGVYFVRSTHGTRSAFFNLLIANLAQTLSAAYHIRWHETKRDILQKEVSELGASARQAADAMQPPSILKLVRHRDSETIIPRIMDAIRTDLGMDRIMYLYDRKRESRAPLLFEGGIDHAVATPNRDAFDRLLSELQGKAPQDVDKLTFKYEPLDTWARNLKRSGLKHVMSYPLSSGRDGVLAWSGGGSTKTVYNRLGSLKMHAASLVDNAESYQRFEEMSYTDDLTGLANKRYFLRRLSEEIARAMRYGRNLALILFDLDELKNTNDTYGHLAGDAVLKRLGQILRNSVRSIDIVARYGGDEFCIIMPETDGTTCRQFMDRLQSSIAGAKFKVDGVDESIDCTISLGGAVYPNDGDEPRKLIFASDMALLKAKESGRNKALLYGEHVEPTH